MEPIFSKLNLNFYQRFLGCLIKNGKKSSTKILLDLTFFELAKKTNVPFYSILKSIFFLLTSCVELRVVNVRRHKQLSCFPSKFNRQFYLVIKHILTVCRLNRKSLSFFKKMSFEIKLLLSNPNHSTLVKTRNHIFKRMMNSGSGLHYRW